MSIEKLFENYVQIHKDLFQKIHKINKRYFFEFGMSINKFKRDLDIPLNS